MDQVHVVRHKVLVEGQQIRKVAREMGSAFISITTAVRLESGSMMSRLVPEICFGGKITYMVVVVVRTMRR